MDYTNAYELSMQAFEILKSDKTDQQKQAEARQLAIDIQNALAAQAISYGELAEIQANLQTLADQTGLTAEFQENGIL